MPSTGTIKILRDHEIQTTDGVNLRGDLYLPAIEGDLSLILYRTPYLKERLWNEFFAPLDCVASGFAAYVQDLRGFGKSDGLPNFADWVRESDDTRDTILALRNEGRISGRIGMAGSSFLGMVQLASLSTRDGLISAIAPAMVTAQPYESSALAECTRFSEAIIWTAQMMVQTGIRAASGDMTKLSDDLKALAGLIADPERLFHSLDQVGLPDCFWRLDGGLLARLTTGSFNPFPTVDPDAMSTPALFSGGWYDTFSTPTVELADQWSRSPSAGGTRHYHGPWSHSNSLFSNVGSCNFGPSASGQGAGIVRNHAAFFQHHLSLQAPTPTASSQFLLFGKKWVQVGENSVARNVELKTQSNALNLEMHGEKDYAPTLGGQTHFLAGGVPGPIDQRPLLMRRDSMLLESADAKEPFDIVGRPKLQFSQMEGSNSHIFLKLCLRRPDGAVLPVQEAVARADESEISFPRIAVHVATGWRVVVLASLSNYPRYLGREANSDRPLAAGYARKSLRLRGPFLLAC